MPSDGHNPFGLESGAFDALLRQSKRPTVFMSPWWIAAWLRTCASSASPIVVQATDGSELAGAATICVSDDEISLAGDSDLFDYRDLIAPSGAEGEFCGALLDYLTEGAGPAPDWKRLVLPSMHEGSATSSAIIAAAAERGMVVEVSEVGVAPALSLPGTWEEFVASLAKRHRHELRRKIRRLESRVDARQTTVTDSVGLDHHMDEFLDLLSATNEEKAAFLTEERREFFHAIAAEAAARDTLRLSFLEVDGRRVAGCMLFESAEEYVLYNSGYDPAMSDLSVGLLNKAFAIRKAIESGLRTFDFLKGAERYKYGLGGLDRAIRRIVITRSS